MCRPVIREYLTRSHRPSAEAGGLYRYGIGVLGVLVLLFWFGVVFLVFGWGVFGRGCPWDPSKH